MNMEIFWAFLAALLIAGLIKGLIGIRGFALLHNRLENIEIHMRSIDETVAGIYNEVR